MSSENNQSNVASNSTTSTIPPFTTTTLPYTMSVPVAAAENKVEREYGERAAKLFEVQTGFLLGKVLTVIDAAIADREQKKAAKDLIRAQFHEQKRHVFSLTTGAQLISGPNGEVEA